MSTGKLFLLLLIIGLSQANCARPEGKQAQHNPNEAWWISTELEARGNSIYGVPISNINSKWKYVLVLDKKYFRKVITENQYQHLQSSPLLFSLKTSIDGDSQEEVFLVGVFESYSGMKGRFIAIARNSNVLKYFEHSGFSGYSSIHLSGGEVRWYKCMECNDYDTINWTGADYALE